MELLELLQLPYLKDAAVVAGRRGMSRTVKSVNIMDAPDIAQFVKSDQLLLTNAYAIKDTPSELTQIIDRMALNQSAGLFIKTKRFLYEIPPDVLKRADELNFPIVELSMQYSLGEVLNQTLGFILEKQTEELRYSLDMHKQFSDMIIKGKGLSHLIEALALILECHVLLTDEENEEIAASSSLRANPYKDIPHYITELLNTLTDEVPSPGNLCLWRNNISKSPEIVFHPIETFSRKGYLTIIRADPPPKSKKPFIHLALEQAVNVIEFEWIKRHAVKERSRRFKNEFFSDLMDGLIKSEDDIYNRGRKYNIYENQPYCCMLAKLEDSHITNSKETKDISITRDMVYDKLKKQLQKLKLVFVLFTKNDMYCILLNLSDIQSPASILEKLTLVQQNMFYRFNLPMSYGIGTPTENMGNIHLSYNKAVEALKNGYQHQKKMFIESYKARETEDLLRLIPTEIIQEYYEATFNHLLELETKEKNEIQKTIQVYLENQCSISDTAKKLFIHRNTVIYRVSKYERLTQRSLLDPNDTLRIRLALIIKNLLTI